MESRSVYPAAIGPDFSALHPQLKAYFSAIPAGSVGTGSGIFDVVGTPRRWLWPALWVLGRAGVVFPVWQRDVPFTVENRSVADGSAHEAVTAIRRFRFPGGDRIMTDVVRMDAGELVDRIGSRGLIEASFSASVDDGGLVLRSTRATVRLGRLRIPIPAGVSPVVVLSERFDDQKGCQRVLVTIDAPALGRLYEYGGSFRYLVSGDSVAGPGTTEKERS